MYIPDCYSFDGSSLIEVIRETKPAWLATIFDENAPKVDSTLGNVHFSTGEEDWEEKEAHWEKVGRGRQKNGETKVS